MARRTRNYQQEYARRIAKGLAEGKTRSQARGHGADTASRQQPVATRGMGFAETRAQLKKLKQSRSVKVMATLESGRVVEIARGKPQGVLNWWEDRIGESGEWEDLGPSTTDAAVSLQVIYY